MTAPDGRDSPSPIGPLLIWQQPHPIAHGRALLSRASRPRDTLERYRDMVMESAEFMASLRALRDARPLRAGSAGDPRAGKSSAARDLESDVRAGVLGRRARHRADSGVSVSAWPAEPKWDEVRAKLSALPVKDGVYLAHENCPQTFTERNRDHPSMLGALGVLPGARWIARPCAAR